MFKLPTLIPRVAQRILFFLLFALWCADPFLFLPALFPIVLLSPIITIPTWPARTHMGVLPISSAAGQLLQRLFQGQQRSCEASADVAHPLDPRWQEDPSAATAPWWKGLVVAVVGQLGMKFG